MVCHVDVIMIFVNREFDVSKVKQLLSRRFKLRDLVKLRYVLGMEID